MCLGWLLMSDVSILFQDWKDFYQSDPNLAGKFSSLAQAHLAENLPQAIHTQNMVKATKKNGLKHALHFLDGHFR